MPGTAGRGGRRACSPPVRGAPGPHGGRDRGGGPGRAAGQPLLPVGGDAARQAGAEPQLQPGPGLAAPLPPGGHHRSSHAEQGTGAVNTSQLTGPHSTVQGITVVGVCAVRELLLVRQLAGAAVLGWGKAGLPDWARAALTRLACLVCIGLALLLARLRVMGSQLPVFTRFDNPAAVADWPARPLTQNFLLRSPSCPGLYRTALSCPASTGGCCCAPPRSAATGP